MKKKVGIRSLRGLCTIIHIEIEPLYIIRNFINLKAAFKILKVAKINSEHDIACLWHCHLFV